MILYYKLCRIVIWFTVLIQRFGLKKKEGGLFGNEAVIGSGSFPVRE